MKSEEDFSFLCVGLLSREGNLKMDEKKIDACSDLATTNIFSVDISSLEVL